MAFEGKFAAAGRSARSGGRRTWRAVGALAACRGVGTLRQLGREQRDRLLVDRGLVPLLEHREIVRAFAPRLPALPAVALEVVRRRGEHIGHAADQVAPTVAVEIDRELEVRRRQELGLPELARPGA